MSDSYWVHATCGHTSPEHMERGLTLEQRTADATLWRRARESHLQLTNDGENVVRFFGYIRYVTASGHAHIAAAADATPHEVEVLYATAARVSASDGDGWPASPCRAGERAISVCRYVDEADMDVALAAVIDVESSAAASSPADGTPEHPAAA